MLDIITELQQKKKAKFKGNDFFSFLLFLENRLCGSFLYLFIIVERPKTASIAEKKSKSKVNKSPSTPPAQPSKVSLTFRSRVLNCFISTCLSVPNERSCYFVWREQTIWDMRSVRWCWKRNLIIVSVHAIQKGHISASDYFGLGSFWGRTCFLTYKSKNHTWNFSSKEILRGGDCYSMFSLPPQF